MVQRVVEAVVVRHDSTPPGERQAMETTTRKVKRRRRPDEMTAIKSRMLQCSRAKADQGRFKRGYHATDCGAVDSAIFFYLACLVCTAPPPPPVSISIQELK